MRKLVSILFLLAAFGVYADTFNKYVLTITNPPADSATIVLNGNTRTWLSNVVNSTIQIANTNNVGWAATNAFNQIAVNPISTVGLARSGTNGLLLSGVNITVTISAGYATLSLTSNTLTSPKIVTVPFSTYPQATDQVYIASQLVTGLEQSSTAFSSTNIALTNYASLSRPQTITGAKTFTSISGAVSSLTNGTFTNPTLQGPQLQMQTNDITNNFTVFSFGTDPSGLVHGNPFRLRWYSTNGDPGARLAFDLGADNQYLALSGAFVADSLEIDGLTINSLLRSPNGLGTVIGDANLIYTNGLYSAGGIISGGGLALGAPATNLTLISSTMSGTNTLSGELIVASFNNTALATNNADVNISTNAYVTIATGPASAFAIHGIAGGVSGRIITLENTTGFSMTLVNDSGIDATAANRAKIGQTADITITANPGIASFRYSGTLSRWVLQSHN